MKILLFIFSALCFTSFGQYTYQNSQGPATLRVVDFIDQNSGYIGGNSGKLLKTGNGGDDWAILNGPTNEKINSLSMVSTDVFYFTAGETLGAYYLYKSVTGGATFEELFIPNSDDPYSVEFLDAQTGFVSARFGGIYKTVNGGVSWYNVLSSTNILGTHFVSPQVGYGFGINTIYKTTDGGENWTYMFNSGMFNLGNTQFQTMFFSSEGHGHVGSEYYGQLVSSQDDFLTVVDHLYDWSIMDIYFTSDMVGYVVEFANPGDRILKTTDGGVTWNIFHTLGQTMLDQYYVNENLGWIVGSGGTIMKYEPNASISEVEDFDLLEVSPNPATDQINIAVKDVEIEEVMIFSNQGVEMKHLPFEGGKLDISNLDPGMYHLVVTTSKGELTEKVVKY
ncbi:MAG: photosystem II stability/assembly factor-like uncharacterized protein [Crocinitomicaceae bacterium]|jgi:photosystem II stability/assembly factor-like uncharacterized protein